MQAPFHVSPRATPPRFSWSDFELFALDRELDLPSTAGRAELLGAMDGSVVAKAAYVGRFRRAS